MDHKLANDTFPFYIFLPLANLWFIRLNGQFPHLRQEVAPTSTRSLALREGIWNLVEEESLSRDSFGLLR